MDWEDFSGACSKQQCSPHVDERAHECDNLGEQLNKIPIVETGTTREMNDSCQESPEVLKTTGCTAQASDALVDQEPCIVYEQTRMDKTVTHPLQSESFCKHKMETVKLVQTVEDEITENQSSSVEAGCSLFGFEGDIMEFDSLMDCTDSQLVRVHDSSDENLLPESHKHNSSNVAGKSTSNGSHWSVEVPSDKGMIKGLISELSGLNKFIMGAWKDLENQKKRRQTRLKLGKMKKLK